MYIEKRWIVPAGLSLLLLSALFAWVLLMLGSRFPHAPGTVSSSPISNVEAGAKASKPVTEAAPLADPAPVAALAPADAMGAQPARVASGPSAPAANEAPAATPSRGRAAGVDGPAPSDSQSNTRGFGDIGFQLQGTYINGPVTVAHISSQGNNDSTNLIMGDDNNIVSNQDHLQSNRSDATPPPEVASAQPASRHQRK